MATAAATAASTPAPVIDGKTIRSDTRDVFRELELSDLEVQDLEIGVYNATIQYCSSNSVPANWKNKLFRDVYFSKARNVYTNLKPDTYVKNTTLINRVKEGEFAPHDLAFQSRDALFPEIWEEINANEDVINSGSYNMKQASMTEEVVCGKCNKRKVSYYELQTRSADEGTSIYYTCLLCGYKWKQN